MPTFLMCKVTDYQQPGAKGKAVQVGCPEGSWLLQALSFRMPLVALGLSSCFACHWSILWDSKDVEVQSCPG